MSTPTERPGAAVVVLAAGSGSRSGEAVNKVLLPLAGAPVVAWSVRDALATPGVRRVVVVVRDGEHDRLAEALEPHLDGRSVDVVTGGDSRHASEHRALAVLAADVATGSIDVIAVHDAARPLAGIALFGRVLEVARGHGGAVPVVPAPDVITDGGGAVAGPLVGMQTPQAFRAGPLLDAFAAADAAGPAAVYGATDTAGVMQAHGPDDVRMVAVTGSARNLKITWPGDLAVASRLV